MKKASIAQAAALVTILTVASKLFGFVREQIIALYFGASGHSDAFIVAQTMPTILATVVISAIGTAFLPVFSERLTEARSAPAAQRDSGLTAMARMHERDCQERRLWSLADTVFTLTGLFALAVAVTGVTAAPTLVRLMSPGFTGETFDLAVQMTRIIFPSVIFGAMLIPARAVLNSFHHFSAPAAAPIAQNAVAITTLIALAGLTSYGVRGLAIGWALGAAVSFLIQVPALRRHGAHFRLRLDLRDPGVRKTFALAVPILFGAAVSQVYILVDRGLASRLPAGSIAALSFADKLRQLPLGIFAAAVATVIYPTLSEMANKKDYDGLKQTLGTGLRLVSLLVLPAAFGLGVLRMPLVRILFERGAFDAADTAATADALLFYCIGMIGMAATQVLSTTLYSLRDTVTPVIVSAIGVGVNIVLDFMLVGPYAHAGLALANSVATVLTAALLLIALRRKIGPAGYFKTGLAVGKIALASLAMAMAVDVAARAGFIQAGQSLRTQALAAVVLVSGGVLVYGLAVLVLGVEEAGTVWRAVGGRIRRFPPIGRG